MSEARLRSLEARLLTIEKMLELAPETATVEGMRPDEHIKTSRGRKEVRVKDVVKKGGNPAKFADMARREAEEAAQAEAAQEA